jgi:hypothetical protein
MAQNVCCSRVVGGKPCGKVCLVTTFFDESGVYGVAPLNALHASTFLINKWITCDPGVTVAHRTPWSTRSPAPSFA